MEGILERYLSIFLPFVATVVLAHFVVRSSGAWQLERMGLASPALLRRLLVASGSAIAIIVGVDLLTGGDLFFRPASTRSVLLIALIVVSLVTVKLASRVVAPIARSILRRIVI